MFFSAEILGKRQPSGLGLYWLVAIGTNKSTITKVTKNELLNAKLSEACMVLVHPPEPLSLRLISALLLGVVRVYGHQCASFEVQVQHIFQLFRKPFSVTEEEKITQNRKCAHSGSLRHPLLLNPLIRNNLGIDITTISRKIQREQIQEFFNFEEPDPFLFDPKFQEGEPEDPYMGFGKILLRNKATNSTKDANSSSRHTDPFVSTPSEINLSEESLALGPAVEDAEDPTGLQAYLEGGLQFDDLGGEDDPIDLGILPQSNANPPATTQRIRHPSSRFGVESEVGRGNQARQRHTSIVGFRMSSIEPQGIQDEDRDNRFDLNNHDNFEFEPPSRFNDALIYDIDQDGELISLNLNPTTLQEINSLKRKASPQPELDEVQRKKFPRVIVDTTTSLSAEDLITMRENYPSNNLERMSRYNDRRRDKIIQAHAEALVHGIPDYYQASKLRKFWLRSVKIPAGKLIGSRKTSGKLTKEKTHVNFENLAVDLNGLRPEKVGKGRRNVESLEELDFHEGSSIQPAENFPWMNLEKNQSKISPFSREPRRPLEDEIIEEIDEEVIGRHRASSYESSVYGRPGSQILPWNRASLAPGMTMGGDYESDHGRMATMDTSGTRSGSHVRRETPVQLRRRSSLLSLSREPTRISSTPQWVRSSLVPKNIRETLGQDLDTDAINFITWASSQIDDPSDFLFSDIAPVASTSRQLAAQTFIKVLFLTSHELIQVIEQDEPYGEVRLKFLAHMA